MADPSVPEGPEKEECEEMVEGLCTTSGIESDLIGGVGGAAGRY